MAQLNAQLGVGRKLLQDEDDDEDADKAAKKAEKAAKKAEKKAKKAAKKAKKEAKKEKHDEWKEQRVSHTRALSLYHVLHLACFPSGSKHSQCLSAISKGTGKLYYSDYSLISTLPRARCCAQNWQSLYRLSSLAA